MAAGSGGERTCCECWPTRASRLCRASAAVSGCLLASTRFCSGPTSTLPRFREPLAIPSSDKYNLAARILNFPNSSALRPNVWVPRDLAAYLSFSWKLQDAFRYAETLVNEYAGDEVFQDVLKSIETDPNGPMVNIERDLIAHLGNAPR